MASFVLFVSLLLSPPPPTTDDTWDCYSDATGAHVCERTIEPCHYEHSPDECVVRVTWLPTKVEEL